VLGRDHRFILNFSLVFQNPHCRQIVFDLLESIQYALSIVCNLRVISGTRFVVEGVSSSSIEHCLNSGEANRP